MCRIYKSGFQQFIVFYNGFKIRRLIEKQVSGCKTAMFNGPIINIEMLNNDIIAQNQIVFIVKMYKGIGRTTSTVHYMSRLTVLCKRN